MTSAASKWSVPGGLRPASGCGRREAGRAGASSGRRPDRGGDRVHQELVASQQALTVLAELVLEHGRWFEALHLGGVRVDAVASIGIEQQRRAQRQVREISILQPDKNQQQWPPRRVELLPAHLLRSRHLAHLVKRPGATLLIGGDRRKRKREPSAVGNIAAGQLLPRGEERGDRRRSDTPKVEFSQLPPGFSSLKTTCSSGSAGDLDSRPVLTSRNAIGLSAPISCRDASGCQQCDTDPAILQEVENELP